MATLSTLSIFLCSGTSMLCLPSLSLICITDSMPRKNSIGWGFPGPADSALVATSPIAEDCTPLDPKSVCLWPKISNEF